MAKIMLVEDDNNLREIYEARLLAEGYEIVSAKDGEEALALAVKEKPDLIISDVMMPKISGFDMLDILRSTPETKDTKVIMMTALSQAEDKARAEKLGADRYLVKSQVTLEDVAKVTREVLGDQTTGGSPLTDSPKPATSPAAPATDSPKTDNTKPAPATITPIPVSTTPDEPVSTISTSADDTSAPAQTSASETAKVDQQVKSFERTPSATPLIVEPSNADLDRTNSTAQRADNLAGMVNDIMDKKQNTSPTASAPEPSTPKDVDSHESSGGFSSDRRVIQPLNTPSSKPNLSELLAKEAANESSPPLNSGQLIKPDVTPPAATPR